MGQFVKSDTSIDALFSKFVLDPEETLNTKEKTHEEADKNKMQDDSEKK
ncbi:hypothetical protein [Carnobacterium funditum]|nr:hypothetical protein [Carnobacterium funditum]